MLSKLPPFRIVNFALLILYFVPLSTSHFTLFFLLSAGAPDTLWTRTYGGDSTDIGRSVRQTNDGGFIIAGGTTSFGAGRQDVYLIRTDLNGDTIWTRAYGGDSTDYGSSVEQTTDGGFIITGRTSSFGAGNYDVYLIRTDLNGDTLWTKTFGGDSTDYGASVEQTTDGGFIIAGATNSFGKDDSDAYLIRANYNGDTLWTKTFGSDSTEAGRALQQINDNGFIIAGFTSIKGPGLNDVYLVRTDSGGNAIWTKTYGGTSYDVGFSVLQTKDDGFIITGTTTAYDTEILDTYIIRINSNGDSLWTANYGGAGIQQGFSIQQTNDGGFIIAGETSPYNGAAFDVYLIRLDKETIGIQGDIPNNFLNLNDFIVSYKNGNTSIRYTIQYSTTVKLEAYDTQGKLVKVITNKAMQKGSYRINWDSKRFGSGVYYIKLSTGGRSVISKAVVLK